MPQRTKKDLQILLGPDLLTRASLPAVLDRVEQMPIENEERAEILESWREHVGADSRDLPAAEPAELDDSADREPAANSQAEPAAAVAPPIALSIRERISRIFGLK